MDNCRWVHNSIGQPIFITPFTDGTCANSSKKYKSLDSVNFKSGDFAENEEFK